MKKNHLLLATLFVMPFISCGSSEDEGEDSSIYQNISEDAKPYVGYWTIKPNDGETNIFPSFSINFYDDEVCYVSYTKPGRYGTTTLFRDWMYDKSTHTLTIENGMLDKWVQWEITAFSELSWVGNSLWSSTQEVYTAQKDNKPAKDILFDQLQKGKWMCDTLTLIGSDGSIIVMGKSTKDLIAIGFKWQATEEYLYDNQKDAVTMTYVHWLGKEGKSDYEIRTKAEVSLVHPYSYYRSYVDVTYDDISSNKGHVAFSKRFTRE